VAALANATHITTPAGVRPLATAATMAAPAKTRVARSQVGRLRFKKNMLNSCFQVDDAYLEAANQPMDSQISKKLQKNFICEKFGLARTLLRSCRL
jgi:hypothetical protein